MEILPWKQASLLGDEPAPLVVLCKSLKENKLYSPSSVMEENVTKKGKKRKISRLVFHGWMGNVIQFKKSRSLPFCIHTDLSLTL